MCVPKSCRKKCGGTRARLLSQANTTLQKEMHVTHLLKQLRITEGILREKLMKDDLEWHKLSLKYGSLRIIEEKTDDLQGSFGTDSDAVPDEDDGQEDPWGLENNSQEIEEAEDQEC